MLEAPEDGWEDSEQVELPDRNDAYFDGTGHHLADHTGLSMRFVHLSASANRLLAIGQRHIFL